ncbi:hypothetical protein [Burkholderia cepacia]|uniref:hypothetical protein n=1 Tax=Burkholderia cepacia TaxID=292 RepID=UPI00298F802A|nr:hypothetical protein [Burkholderia cepacia]
MDIIQEVKEVLSEVAEFVEDLLRDDSEADTTDAAEAVATAPGVSVSDSATEGATGALDAATAVDTAPTQPEVTQ